MFNRRLLVLLVERIQDDNVPFATAVPDALREYIEALEKDWENGLSTDPKKFKKPNVVDDTCVEFKTSNGCEVRAIAGKETFFNQ